MTKIQKELMENWISNFCRVEAVESLAEEGQTQEDIDAVAEVVKRAKDLIEAHLAE